MLHSIAFHHQPLSCGNAEITATARAIPPENRLHEGVGYVTPEDEHTGRGPAIRARREAGMRAAHQTRVATRRQLRQDHP